MNYCATFQFEVENRVCHLYQTMHVNTQDQGKLIVEISRNMSAWCILEHIPVSHLWVWFFPKLSTLTYSYIQYPLSQCALWIAKFINKVSTNIWQTWLFLSPCLKSPQHDHYIAQNVHKKLSIRMTTTLPRPIRAQCWTSRNNFGENRKKQNSLRGSSTNLISQLFPR